MSDGPFVHVGSDSRNRVHVQSWRVEMHFCERNIATADICAALVRGQTLVASVRVASQELGSVKGVIYWGSWASHCPSRREIRIAAACMCTACHIWCCVQYGLSVHSRSADGRSTSLSCARWWTHGCVVYTHSVDKVCVRYRRV